MNSKYLNKRNVCVLGVALLYAGCICPDPCQTGNRTQGHVLVVIDSDRDFVPDDIYVEVGNTVVYKAEEPTLLCVQPAEVFGGTEFRIDKGGVLQLDVVGIPPNPNGQNPDGRFITRSLPGDITTCGPGGEEGGGRVGGGG